LTASITPTLHYSITPLSIFRYIYRKIEKNISPDQLFSPGITGMLRRTVGGVGGFEERRQGKRFKLALRVQLNDGTGTTCDISTSGIFAAETRPIFRADGDWFKSRGTKTIQRISTGLR
jgi:hypothetical protein